MPTAVRTWLLLVCAAIWMMVVIGGITRLTGSGLSITEWKPIMGAIPPLSHAEWEEAFAKYKGIPQFRLLNPDMDLSGFKFIFFWEYLHRLWGRLLGIFFFLPLAWFAWKGQIRGALRWQLPVALLLGGGQGFLGWFMVQSGLVDRPWVSAYRLTAHLVLALFLFSWLWWIALGGFRWPKRETAPRDLPRLRGLAHALLGLLALQIVYGGFMAGTKAALAYPEFPTMLGRWIPPGLFTLRPLWHNFFENPAWIHVMHRGIGTLLLILIGALGWMAEQEKDRPLRALARTWGGLVLLQYTLGVTTVLFSLGKIPLLWGALHQAVAVAVLAAALACFYRLSR
jgi:cytochrome c oxidase assembly protein subunit 15